jgi:hypothetical protein
MELNNASYVRMIRPYYTITLSRRCWLDTFVTQQYIISAEHSCLAYALKRRIKERALISLATIIAIYFVSF